MAKKKSKNDGKSDKQAKGGGGKGKPTRKADEQISHSVGNPIRLDSLSILFERIASPKEIAQQLAVPLATAAFHVKELRDNKAVELVRMEQRRGAVEHYYRATVRPEIKKGEWGKLGTAGRREIARLTLQAITAEGLASLRHGRMEVDDNLSLIWLPFDLDAQAREELAELEAETLERLNGIRDRCAARNGDAETGQPTRIVAMMSFDRAEPGRKKGARKPSKQKGARKRKR